jgi:hypothetical protein
MFTANQANRAGSGGASLPHAWVPDASLPFGLTAGASGPFATQWSGSPSFAWQSSPQPGLPPLSLSAALYLQTLAGASSAQSSAGAPLQAETLARLAVASLFGLPQDWSTVIQGQQLDDVQKLPALPTAISVSCSAFSQPFDWLRVPHAPERDGEPREPPCPSR